MTRYIIDLFSFTDIPVHFIHLTERPDGSLSFLQMEDYTKDLSNIADHFGWNDLFLVSLSKEIDEFPYHTYYESSIQKFKEQHKCLQLHRYVVNDRWFTFDLPDFFNSSWLANHDRPAIIIFARHVESNNFLHMLKNLAEETQIPILGHDCKPPWFENSTCGFYLDHGYPSAFFVLEEEQRKKVQDVLYHEIRYYLERYAGEDFEIVKNFSKEVRFQIPKAHDIATVSIREHYHSSESILNKVF